MPYRLSEEQARKVITNIRLKIRDYFKQHKLTYAVFGKSEGLDSSVIAGLLSGIEGIQPVGVVIPIETPERVCCIAEDVLDHFSIPRLRIDLTEQYLSISRRFQDTGSIQEQLSTMVRELGDEAASARIEQVQKVALGNIKVRLRMITLYHVAQLLGGLVVSTDNYSEWWMGFWTLCGDVGDLAPIQQIFKGNELYTIGKVLGVPSESLNAPPSDGLNVTKENTDEAQLGLPYPELDRVIMRLLDEDYLSRSKEERELVVECISVGLDCSPEIITSIAERLAETEFKRRWPVTLSREEIGLPPLVAILAEDKE